MTSSAICHYTIKANDRTEQKGGNEETLTPRHRSCFISWSYFLQLPMDDGLEDAELLKGG